MRGLDVFYLLPKCTKVTLRYIISLNLYLIFFCYCFLKSKFKQRDKDASWVSALYDKKGNRPLFLDRSKERKMANLSMESLPLGFRFSPTDEELINHYLRLKNEGHDSGVQVIAEVDFYKFDPWELPGTLFFFPRLILCFSEYLSSSVLFKEILFSSVFLAFICIWIFIFLFYF